MRDAVVRLVPLVRFVPRVLVRLVPPMRLGAVFACAARATGAAGTACRDRRRRRGPVPLTA